MLQKVLFAIALPISAFVTLLFWVLLAPSSIFRNVDESPWNKTVSSFNHIVQFLLAIAEIMFSSILVEWKFILAPMIFLLFYSCLILVLKLTTNIWPYGFMYSFFGTLTLYPLNMIAFLVISEAIIAGLFAIVKYLRQLAHGRYCAIESTCERVGISPSDKNGQRPVGILDTSILTDKD
jgi:hypothetical protein